MLSQKVAQQSLRRCTYCIEVLGEERAFADFIHSCRPAALRHAVVYDELCDSCKCRDGPNYAADEVSISKIAWLPLLRDSAAVNYV